MSKVVITSGYFNPLHIGHVNCIREAKRIGDYLVVIVNNDQQVKLKGSIAFMPEQERVEIIKSLRFVDEVFLSIDKDKSVSESIKEIAKMHSNEEIFFAKGGDRNSENIPEKEVCDKFGIKIVNNVGGGKIQSSSWLLKSVPDLGKIDKD